MLKKAINLEAMQVTEKIYIENCDNMFEEAEAFLDKYNSGKPLPADSEDIKKWLIKNIMI